MEEDDALNNQKQKKFPALSVIIKIFLFGSTVALMLMICIKAMRSHQIIFTSLPPVPIKSTYLPETQMTSIIKSLRFESVETNQPEIAGAFEKTAKLATALTQLETKVYSENSDLWTYEHYQPIIDAWHDKSASNGEALNKYEHPNNLEEAHKRQKICADLQRILPLVLLKEQTKDPIFGPLIKDTVEAVLKASPNYMSFADCDAIVKHYNTANLPRTREVSSKSYDQWLSEINRRYPDYASAIDLIINNNKIPPSVVADIKEYVSKQTISGLVVELYIPTHTPKELTKLRQELDKQARELMRLREPMQKNK